MRNLTLTTNSNDFNPMFTVVDLDMVETSTREVHVSREEAERNNLQVLRNGEFPHMVVCMVTSTVPGSGHLQHFRNRREALAFMQSLS